MLSDSKLCSNQKASMSYRDFESVAKRKQMRKKNTKENKMNLMAITWE